MNEYYDILGVGKKASREQIRKAFLKKSKVYHPDAGGDEKKFVELKEAYNVLSDTALRTMYDKYGSVDCDFNLAVDKYTKEYLVFILTEVMKLDPDDIMAVMQKESYVRIDKIDNEIKITEKNIQLCEKFKKRVKKFPESPIIIDILKAKHIKERNKLQELEARKAGIERVCDMLDDYEFEIKQRPYDMRPEGYENIFDRLVYCTTSSY